MVRLVPSSRVLVVAFALVLIAGGFYGLARESSMFAVRQVEVKGASPALAAQVRIALHGFQGRSLVGLDGDGVQARVDGLPAVRSSSYDRAFPHTLRVFVVPERPVAVLRRGPDSWLVSARGRVTERVQRGRFRVLPRIWLPPRTEIELGSTLADGSGGVAARSVAVFLSSGLRGRIGFVRAQDGQLTMGLRGGLEVRLGRPVDLALKIAVVRSILPRVAPLAAGGPEYLDVTVPERPVAGRNPQVEG